MIKHFAKNDAGRDFVVGDIHGYFSLLEQGLQVVNFNETEGDRLFSVGDLVDRGPESDHCLNWLGKPWFHAIKGNHEWLFSYDDEFIRRRNGGGWALDGQLLEHWKYEDAFGALPLAIEVETDNGLVGLVHAEVPGDDWRFFKGQLENPSSPEALEALEHIALWSRKNITARVAKHDGRERFTGVAGIDRVICGHSIVPEPTELYNVSYIDTSAYKNGYLTLACIQGAGSGAYHRIHK